jgi:hypothetical protein
MSLVIADVSQYQGVVHPTGPDPIIVRGHNGYSSDPDFAANRAAAHAAGCAAVGIYQYLPANVDAASAARALMSAVGVLAAIEWLICDLETGNGDEQPRWQAWNSTARSLTGGRLDWLYGGAYFAATHDLHPDWIAAYQAKAPAGSYKLWQYTDRQPWPWGRSDASVFAGSLAEFLIAAGITTVPVAPVPPANTPPLVKVTGNGCGGDRLAAGMALGPNQYIESSTGWMLLMQPDGNLVKYRPNNGGPAWSIENDGAHPVPGSVLIQQADGNLVVYAPDGHVVWNAATQGHPGYWDVIQPDGNWVEYGGDPQSAIFHR